MTLIALTTNEVLILLGIPTLAGVIVKLIFDIATGKFKKIKLEAELTKRALQAILRDRLRQHYIHYMDEGVIDYVDKQNFDHMYQIYHLLGKNGVMDGMYNEVMNLPIMNNNKKYKNKKEID